MDRSLRFRVRAWWLAAAAVGCGCGAAAAIVACITPFPPPVPTLQTCRPEIDRASVRPPENGILTEWPADNTFVVPVRYQSCDPTDGFQYAMFIDYSPGTPPSIGPSSATFAADGGEAVISITVGQPQDGTTCHTVEIIVAHALSPPSVPDSLGEDSVHWFYSASGGINECPQFDAGDGSFPGDAPSDTLPFVPDGGSG